MTIATHERAALIKRLRTDLFDAVPDDNDMQNVLDHVARQVEVDGKLVALAEDAPHTDQCDYWDDVIRFSPGRCNCWKADYAAAKEAL